MAEIPSGQRDGVPLGKRIQRRWKQTRRKALGLSARGLIAVLSLVPFAWTRRLLPLLTRFLARPLIRKQILENLELAYGDSMPARQKQGIVRRICTNLGSSMAETLALYRGKLPADSVSDNGVVGDVGALLEEGHGLILVTAHMGNWEALGFHAASSFPDHQGAAIAKRNSNPEFQKLAERMRGRTGMETFYQDDSPRAAIRHLAKGGFLAVVPDQDMRALAGIFLPFFGRDAYTPVGPATLSVVSGSPMLVVTSFRDEGGLLHTESFEALRPRKGAARQEEVERLTRAWSEQVERSIRAHPSDWMWFHQRWRTTPESLQARKDRLRRQFHEQRRASGS